MKMKRKTCIAWVITLIMVVLLSFGCTNDNSVKSDDKYSESKSDKKDKKDKKNKKDKKDKKQDSEDVVDPGDTDDDELSGYYQFAVFGNDGHTGEFDNFTSDTIMIVSVNKESNDIKICSLNPYTYLYMPGDFYSTCNRAYVYGGPEAAVEMLNTNFDLEIQGYLTMDFKSIVGMVDDLGGVSIEIDESEMEYLNGYLEALAEDLHMIDQYVEITDTGLQQLDGLQASAYSRVSSDDNGGYSIENRMPRQQQLFISIFDQANNSNENVIEEVWENAYPYIVSSYDLSTLIDYTKEVSGYNIVDMTSYPFLDCEDILLDNLKDDGVATLDHEANVIMLHEFLFDENDYVPSDIVQTISEQITTDIGDIQIEPDDIDFEEALTDGKFEVMIPPKELDSYPKSFRKVYVRVDGVECSSYTDDRYFILYFNTQDGYEGWYVYDSYDGFYVRYDDEFMNASGKASYDGCSNVDANLDDWTLEPMDVDDEPEALPNGFRQVYVRLNGIEVMAWTNDEYRYYIFCAVSPHGTQEWYIFDHEERYFVEYEPAFMAGGY